MLSKTLTIAIVFVNYLRTNPLKLFSEKNVKKMKKLFLALAVVFLLQNVIAANVNVEFNFPLESRLEDVSFGVSVPNDSNAFTAFVQAAEQAGIELSVTHFSFGAFIECVEQICTSEDFSRYWLFSVNNTPSGTGASDYTIQEGDTVSLDYFDGHPQNALEWILDNQQDNGLIGSNNFQHSFALMALSLAGENGITGQNESTNHAIDYLLSLQQTDAGFGDDLQSSVAVMALISNGKILSDFDVGTTDTLETIASHQQADGGFASGSVASDVDTTSWVILAFAQGGKEMPQTNDNSPAEFLLSAQHENGSFGYTAGDNTESIDFTEEALIALKAFGEPQSGQINEGLEWLASKQGANGCIEDGFRTALGAIAFRTWDQNSRAENAVSCLKVIQNGDGSFGRNTNESNAIDTGIGAIALSGKTFPLTVSEDTPDGNESDGTIGYNSIVKFRVEIKNNGNVSAENVQVLLEGIPFDWVLSQGSIDEFDEIEPGETKTAEIFVQMKAPGSFLVQATVTTNTAAEDFLSNVLPLTVEEAFLAVRISVEE